MKIIRLSTFLDFGGVEKRLTNIASNVDEHQWVFCAINKGGQAEKDIMKKGKQVHCLNLPYKIPNFKTIYKLYRYFKEQMPDVVHSSGAEANFHGVLAAKMAGVKKIVAEEIGVPSQSLKAKIIFKIIYRYADWVVGNSKAVVQHLRKINGVPEKKIKQIPNPILFTTLPQKVIQKNILTLISVSRLEKVKNIDGFLRVLKKLDDDGFSINYIIVGSGTEEDNLRKMVVDLNISKLVTFNGYTNNPYPLFLQADVYILNSFTEGFSNSLIEAMYSGTPSLSSKSGSASEIIEDGVNGWLVNVDDEEDLYDKLKSIINLDASELQQIGSQGKKFVEENYSLANHIKKLDEIYL